MPLNNVSKQPQFSEFSWFVLICGIMPGKKLWKNEQVHALTLDGIMTVLKSNKSCENAVLSTDGKRFHNMLVL